MTTEIAEVGFSVPTAGLEKGADALEALNPAAAKAEHASEKLEKQSKKTNTVFGKLARGGNVVNSVFGKLAVGARNLVTGFTGLVTGAIAGFAFSSMIDGARTLSASIGELATLLPAGSARLAEMQAAARSMADEFGTNAAFQLQAFYGAVSAGADTTAKAIQIVDAANRLAIGGITDVTVGVDILTTATNAYASSGLLASAASDALFVGMRAGKTTIGELASGLGNVIPIAASLGVEFDELVAGTAALTLQGLSTATAITSLRAILSGVAKPTSQAAELAEQLGIDFSTTALRAKGLAGFLQDVVDKTDGSADKLSVLFGSVEALNAALAFAGEGGNAFNSILDDMATKAGATDAAVSAVASGLDKRWGDILQRITNLSIDFGYALLSVIVPAAEAVIEVFELVAENTDVLVISMGVLAATQAPALAAGLLRLAFALTSYNALAIYSATLSYALAAAMYAIPFVAVVGGLTLAYRWFTSSGEAAVVTAEAITSVDERSTALSETLVNVASGLAQTEEQLRSISQTEAFLAQQQYMEEYQAALRVVGDEVLNVAEALRLEGVGISETMMADFYDLAVAVERGNRPVGDLIAKFDQLGVLVPEIAPIVNTFLNAAQSAETLNGKVERSNALIRFLAGEATEADKALLLISQRNISTPIGAGANEAARLAQNLGISLDLATRLNAFGPQQGPIQGGRGGDPREMGGSAFDWQNREADEFLRNYKPPSLSLGGGTTSGSSGGGSAVAQEITELQRLNEELNKIVEPFNQAKSAYDVLQTAMDNGLITNDQFTDSLGRIQEAFLATGGSAEQWAKVVGENTSEVAKQMNDLREKSISRLGDELIDLAVDGEASFGDMAKSIIKDLLKIAWQALVVKPLLESIGNIGSGGGGGGFLGILKGFFGFADGGAFGSNGVTAFANGGAFTNSIVTQSTPFSFAKGTALGEMGEAGPEAIMPLKRGSNGSLGVQLYGGQGKTSAPANNTVQVTNVYKIEGAVSEDKIVQSVRAQGEQTKEDVKQSMVGWLNEYDQNGTM